MASLLHSKEYQFKADDGTPLNAGTVQFYTVGTTTPKNTYPTEADAIVGTNANPNPITLAADGRADNTGTNIQVWISGGYRRIVKNSAGTPIADDDGIYDVVSAAALQKSSATFGGNNTGSVNSLAFAYTPALTSYVNGMELGGRITGDNTSSVEVNLDGLGAKSLVKRDGRAIRRGDLQGPEIIKFAYDSASDVVRLLTPVGPNANISGGPTAGAMTLTSYTNVLITGTDAITSFVIPDGEACDCVADAALPITTGASLLIYGIPSGKTITLAAGCTFRVLGEASSVARVFLHPFSSTYTPTLSNTTNVAASTAYACMFTVTGGVVTVTGKVDIDPTGAGATLLGISIPVASDFANDYEAAGVAFSGGTAAGEGASILADTANDRVSLSFVAVDTANKSYGFTFSYRII